MEVFIHGIGRTTTDNCGYEQIDFQKKTKKNSRYGIQGHLFTY